MKKIIAQSRKLLPGNELFTSENSPSFLASKIQQNWTFLCSSK